VAVGGGGSSSTTSGGGAGAAGGSTSTGGAGGGGTGGGGGQDPSPAGCSDGTREAYIDVNAEPAIAGCSGGFSVAGVVSVASLTPACGRVSGNDSSNPSGTGCSVADLCAVGWHVCESSADVASSASTGMCPPAESTPTLWITRQTGPDGAGDACASTGVNNLLGCGALIGNKAEPNCAPLNQSLHQADCAATSTWFCGTVSPTFDEATIVTKSGSLENSDEGGALCCRG